MKPLPATITLIAVILFGGALFAQETEAAPEKRDQLMKMVQDSTMMRMMVRHIADDDGSRRLMMREMMASAKGDSSRMKAMCRMMLDDPAMHGMMMRMMEGGHMEGGMLEKKGAMMDKAPKSGKGKEKDDHHEQQ